MTPTLQVFTKETREMMRDKRVRFSAFLGPFLLVVMLLYLFGMLSKTLSKPSSHKIHVVRSEAANPLIAQLREAKVNVLEVPSLAEGERLVRDGKAAIVLQFPDDYAERAAQGRPTAVTAVYDSKETRSQIALGVLERGIEQQNKQAVEQLLAARGLPKELAAPVKVNKRDVTRAKGASEMLTGILPYLIVIWAFFGGMTIAGDLVAGEKERTTLETLLIAPVSRTQIVMGKFWALALVCLLSSLSSLVGVVAFALIKTDASEALFKEGLGISMPAVAATVAVLIPTVVLFAAMLVAISAYAKNTREAQTHLSLASFAVMMPAVFSQFIGFTDYASARWVSLVPVLNTATAIRNALLGKLDLVFFLATVAVGLVLGAAMVWLAVALFRREQVLTRV